MIKEEILQAFDCFVFPSIIEGLGMAIIEAQASGLLCLSSDSVPKETNVSNSIRYMSLKLSADEWAKELQIIKREDIDRQQMSHKAIESIKDPGYEINTQAQKLLNIYLAK